MTQGSVSVIGLGLIGGSLVRAADAAGWKVRGASRSEATAAAARDAGFDVTSSLDDLLRYTADDALVVLAVPLPAVAEVLAVVARHIPRCRLTDVVSVKQPVGAAVARRAPQARYVGGHPMAGTSASGWSAGTATLFTRASWVVGSDDGTDLEVWTQVARLALDCGAHVVPAGAADHDAAVARVSHLPHVLAAVLASVGSDGGPLAMALGAGSFSDGTRVASSAPELVRAMCEANRDALLDAVDDALGRLGAARGSLASTGALAATLQAGHRARQSFESRHHKDGTADIDLTAPGALTQLREIGRSGGRVIALEGTRCRVQV
ncbi:MAG TPA: prephenate dehydrogenase [Pseudonocardiaceae bacterium]|jgi:prephenate dehydrogenase|nr:prephenate dehydrogenase [Pseudonocardiaceae bacterium]